MTFALQRYQECSARICSRKASIFDVRPRPHIDCIDFHSYLGLYVFKLYDR